MTSLTTGTSGQDAATEPRPGRGSAHLPSLTALRFVAAVLVFGNHFGDFSLDPDSRLNAILQTGGVGVTFFFILSGFVLTWSARPGDRPLAFYRRRVARIVPNHVFTWLTALLLLLGLVGSSVGIVPAVASLTLLQAWHPSQEVQYAVNAVAWTLSVEMFFYAVFPFILPTLAALTALLRRIAIAIAVLAVVASAAVVHVVSGGAGHWVGHLFPPARLPEFMLGILLALELSRGRRLAVRPWLMVGLGFLAWMVCHLVPPAFRVAAVTVVPFSLLIMAAASADLAGRPWLFRHRPLIRLGEWSFAFYLVHTQVMILAEETIGLGNRGPVFDLVALPLLLGASIAASAGLFMFVERPLERRLRGRRPGVPAAPAVTAP